MKIFLFLLFFFLFQPHVLILLFSFVIFYQKGWLLMAFIQHQLSRQTDLLSFPNILFHVTIVMHQIIAITFKCLLLRFFFFFRFSRESCNGIIIDDFFFLLILVVFYVFITNFNSFINGFFNRVFMRKCFKGRTFI